VIICYKRSDVKSNPISTVNYGFNNYANINRFSGRMGSLSSITQLVKHICVASSVANANQQLVNKQPFLVKLNATA